MTKKKPREYRKLKGWDFKVKIKFIVNIIYLLTFTFE